MKKAHVYVIAAAAMLICGIQGHTQSDQYPPNPGYDLYVRGIANVHMTVDLWSIPYKSGKQLDEDSTFLYTLFDGILDRDCLLTFVDQPQFWSRDRSVDTAVILPFPIGLKGGMYSYVVKTPDTTYCRRMAILK